MTAALRLFATFTVLTCSAMRASAIEITLEPTNRGVTITADGQPFAEYRIDAGPKPILWPLVGPDGLEMTRAYPMRDVAGEKQDHPHQRSCWLTHGSVNGVDFWSENEGHGSIQQRSLVIVKPSSSDEAKFETVNDWLGPDGKKLCEDRRRLTFHAEADVRWIDFEFTIEATDGHLTFGDTKEGSFGVRVPTALDVNEQQPERGGHILNSEGQADVAAWGQPARWVDYYGTLEGKPTGIAILNHPDSYGFPTHWHVRTYGLFAANPFGLNDFYPETGANGAHTIPAGETMTLRYRVILHRGDAEAADIERHYTNYVK